MPPRKYTLKAQESHRGKRLDQVLAEWLPEALSRPVSKSKVRKLIVAGAVYLNGSRVRIASKEIRPGARIDAMIDLQRLEADATAWDRPFQMEARHVLYEDEDLIAVDKPPGLPTQPTLDEARANLFAAVKRFLAERDRVPQPYVGLHHRLDRDTSGIVLFTKTQRANAGVSRMFAEHLATKAYYALTGRPSKPPGDAWTVKDHLGRKPGPGKKSVFASVRSGGDFAHTDFKLMESLPQGLWIEALPRTGRTHQIRVHLSEAGMPILGDPTYGPQGRAGGLSVPRLMLHAHALTFPHPVSNLEISVQSPIPEDFNLCLQRLRQRANGSA